MMAAEVVTGLRGQSLFKYTWHSRKRTVSASPSGRLSKPSSLYRHRNESDLSSITNMLAAMVLILTLGDGSGIEIAARHRAW
jgi:hypothetical protein